MSTAAPHKTAIQRWSLFRTAALLRARGLSIRGHQVVAAGQ